MNTLLLVVFLTLGWNWSLTQVQGQSLNSINEDPISPLINFLQQLQSLRQIYANFNPRQILNSTPNGPLTLSLPSGTFPEQVGQGSNTPLASSSSGNGLNDNISGSINNNNKNNAGIGSGTVGSRNERRNAALTEILQGVRTASLERILRGSIAFSRNDYVRSVGGNVISNLFSRPNYRLK